ncbi:toll/interleukin-1 receptor domain-containing protein [Gimesia sp.]|uniref:toll/interleukin-1 receptor domain-containing protein n=1 Tax=Gimesia sp. TaxID=2024833 RepID=UPI003A90BBBE
MTDEGEYVFQFGDFKTLPLYCVMMKLLEEAAPFSKARGSVTYVDPDYEPKSYTPTSSLLNKLGGDSGAAIRAVKSWSTHSGDFMYYVQFKDDPDRRLHRALHDHTETLSILCDSRLKLDPTPLWKQYDGLFSFAAVHSEYREDPERDEKWQHYANRLKKVHERMTEDGHAPSRLIQRMVRQIELQAVIWPTLPEIHMSKNTSTPTTSIELFYSYSHKDEFLRDQLQTHLSSLRRNGVISNWHDRRISAGREWEGQIDDHLNSAQVILLLISADFLASDYCSDIELERAMERHNAGEARVIPVILRACDWAGSQFCKLQALPKDAEPITSWQNRDEAFTDVAKGIRIAVDELVRKE